jgi:hypothetical protein
MRNGRSPSTQAEWLAVLEQRASHIEAELTRISTKVDEMHAVLMQTKGVRWTVIAVAGLVGFVTGISHWLRGASIIDAGRQSWL